MSERRGVAIPDLEETGEFLRGLPLAPSEHLAAIPEGRGPVVRSFGHADIENALVWLAEFQGGQNCYYHPNPLHPGVRNRKARREDVAAARMLHVDIDDLGALGRIEAFPLAPSVVIMSGGGYQCLWFLLANVEDLGRIEALNRRIAELLGGDSCHSADHLMRLPGTLNVPNAKKRAKGRTIVRATLVRALTDYSRSYALADIERGLGMASRDAKAVDDALLRAPVGPLDLTTLVGKVSDFTLELIRNGDHLERPIGSIGATYPSRSEAVFRVACDLAQAGFDEAGISSVLMDPANGISRSILEKANPEAYALRQARQALRSVGDGWPNVNKAGHPVPSFANALVALPRLGLRFEYDEFQNRKRVDSAKLQDLVGELTDDVCAAIRHEVLRRWSLDLGKEHVRDAAHTLCLENTVHPIRDYLDGLRWDGQARVSTWLSHYLGAEDTPLHRAMAELVLLAAVRRVRRPGVKFDSILVLEGRQGSGKSTAINILAGEAHFSDQDILTLDPKAQMEALEGVWIYELGELQGLNRTKTDKVKAFASRRVDRGRPAYARFREDRPRQTIFIGTTNDEQYLRDATGNRRFWPVRTGQIDLHALRLDRDQIWAEAAHLEAQGTSLTLPEDLWMVAAEAQDARLMDDPWLEALRGVIGTVEDGVGRITTTEALRHLEMTADRQSPSSAKRLAPVMRKLGWTGPKQLRIGGKVLRGYERPHDPADKEPY